MKHLRRQHQIDVQRSLSGIYVINIWYAGYGSNNKNKMSMHLRSLLQKAIETIKMKTLCDGLTIKIILWNRLIPDSEYHRVLPQTVTGFFYHSWNGKGHFTSVTSECPSLINPWSRSSWCRFTILITKFSKCKMLRIHLKDCKIIKVH
jgi:hypothetical protein